MSAELAVEALLDQRPIEATALREFLDKASKRLESGKDFYDKGTLASVRFCRSFCDLLVETGDLDLVKVFLSNYFPRLGLLSENETLIPIIAKIINNFDWGTIGEDMLDKLGRKTDEDEEVDTVGDTALEMTLQVLDVVQVEAAREDLLKMAAKMALKIDKMYQDGEDKNLNSSKVTGILWKHVIQFADETTFDTIATHFKEKDPKQLGPAVEMFSQYFGDLEELSVKRGTLTSIAERRVEWLKESIDELDTTFSWEMAGAKFSDNKKIEDFLRGPDTSMKTQGLITFSGLPEARKFAAKYARDKGLEASFKKTPARKSKSTYVTITKTRLRFDAREAKLVKYREELEELQKLYEETASIQRKKKLRRE